MPIISYILLNLLINTSVINNTDSVKAKSATADLMKLVNEVIQQKEKLNDIETEIDALLVDDTKTKSGKDFYDLFYAGWEAPESAKNYTITISEKPYRINTTLIVILINETPVYQSVLQPRLDIIEAISEEAILTTQDYLSNYTEIVRQLNGDDMSGSGIY